MSVYDVVRDTLSGWPWLQRPVVALVWTIVLSVLSAICLIAVAYIQGGVIAGYPFGENVHLPRNAIIMMEAECSTLPGWVPYKRSAGRIPIGAGTGSDVNNITRTFRVGDNDNVGEYIHELTIPEMPSHSHSQAGRATGSHRCAGDCSEYSPGGSMLTGATGSGQAHNNMPPILALNFCVQH